MDGGAPKNQSWDQRFTERIGRRSWEAANDPTKRPRNASFREQIRSPYYWFAILSFGVAALIWSVAGPGWPHAVAAVLYVVALLVSALSRRDARAASLRGKTTHEK